MTIREMAEQREVAYFSPYASLSSKSRDATGRAAMRYPSGLSKRPGSYFTF